MQGEISVLIRTREREEQRAPVLMLRLIGVTLDLTALLWVSARIILNRDR